MKEKKAEFLLQSGALAFGNACNFLVEDDPSPIRVTTSNKLLFVMTVNHDQIQLSLDPLFLLSL